MPRVPKDRVKRALLKLSEMYLLGDIERQEYERLKEKLEAAVSLYKLEEALIAGTITEEEYRRLSRNLRAAADGADEIAFNLLSDRPSSYSLSIGHYPSNHKTLPSHQRPGDQNQTQVYDSQGHPTSAGTLWVEDGLVLQPPGILVDSTRVVSPTEVGASGMGNIAFLRLPDGWYLQDQGAGVEINGVKLNPGDRVRLANGDVVRVWNTTITVYLVRR